MILLFSKIYKNIKKIAKKKKLEYNFIMVHFIKEKYQEIICMDFYGKFKFKELSYEGTWSFN